jgi:DNA polymerase-3 subunit delta'
MIYSWQNPQWDYVQSLLKLDHLPHALLLSGVEHIGKKQFANELAQSLLCLNPSSDHHACGECKSCKLYQAQSHPDHHHVKLLEGKKDIPIGQIREVIEFVNLSHSISSFKTIVIDTAEKMNKNAANSVLKTLEEPAHNTIIVLESSQPKQLLPTIRSRCQVITFGLPEHPSAKKWLEAQMPQNDVDTLLSIARGRPLLALEYDKDNDLELRTRLINDIGQVMTGKRNWVDAAQAWENTNLRMLMDWQLSWVQDLVLIQQSSAKVRSIDVEKQLVRLASLLDKSRLFSLYQALIERTKLVAHPVNKRLFLEDVLLCWKRHYSV